MKEPSPERWRRISAILDRLLDLPPTERPAALEASCGGDAALQDEVAALLAAADGDEGLLDRPAAEAFPSLVEALASGEKDPSGPDGSRGGTAGAAEAVAPGDRIGPFQVVSELGRGGMGVVYLAERADGQFQQRVALKLLKRGLDTDEIQARFLRERQILARLQHPRIARLLDGGVTAGGRPWFAMEHVQGEPITAWCDARQAGVEERLRLFSEVCEAVQAAHRTLVVHRDLKPSNILVTAAGEVKLLDFGIAKLLADEPGDTAPTRQDVRALTPEYAAPEQVRGESITTATDVYALGVLLYELLTGRRPYALGAAGAGWQQAILETQPAQPSRAVLDAGREVRRGLSPERLARRLRGDLDVIVLTALRKEPERRYPTAEALAQDIARHLDGLPVRARKDTAGYRARKFLVRHRWSVAAAGLILVALVAGLAGTAWQARRAAGEAARAREVKDFLVEIFQVTDPSASRGEQVTARELLDRGAARIEAELGDQPALQAEMMALMAGLHEKLGLYDQALPLAERALEIRRGLHTGAHRDVADSLRQRGLLLYRKGDYAGAEPVLQEALDMHRATLGESDPELAEDLDWLAMTLRGLGKMEPALELTRQSLDIRSAAFGDDDVRLGDSLNNLAVMLRETGSYAEAEAIYRRLLEGQRRQLGADHPQSLLTLNNLAALLLKQGRPGESVELNREALEISRKLHGEDHPSTVMGRNNLATALMQTGAHGEAETLFREVLAHWERAAGAEHPNAVVTRNNLATALRARGQLEEAEAIYRDLAALWRRQLGETHPYTAIALSHLATVLRGLDRLEEAGAFLGEALAIRRGLHGEEHPDVALTLYEMALLAQARGDTGEAERLHRESLALREKLLGPDHPATALSRAGLGGSLRAAGRLDEAAALQTQALAALEAAHPADHPEVALARLELGRTLAALGRHGEAEPLLQAAAAAATERHGAGSWQEAEVRSHLAACLAASGRTAEAREMAAAARHVLTARFGAGHRLAREAGAIARPAAGG